MLTISFLVISLMIIFSYQNCSPSNFEFAPVETLQPSSVSNCMFNGEIVPEGESRTAYVSSVADINGQCVSEIRRCENSTLLGSYQYASCNPVINAPKSCLFNGLTIPHGENVIGYSTPEETAPSLCQYQLRKCNNGVIEGNSSFRLSSCNQKYKTIIPLACSLNDLPSALRSTSFNMEVSQKYKNRLNRCADINGMGYWIQNVTLLRNGNYSHPSFLSDFEKSAQNEPQNVVNSLCFAGDSYLTQTTYCQRTYGQSNYNYQLQQRPNYEVLIPTYCSLDPDIPSSAEAQNIIIEIYKNSILNRCPDWGGLTYWSLEYDKSKNRSAIENSILSNVNSTQANEAIKNLCLPGDTSTDTTSNPHCISNGNW